MHKTLAEIADIVNGKVVGDKNLVITGLNGLQEARAGDITFLANPKYIPLLKKTAASAIITARNVKAPGKSIIQTDNPSLAFADLIACVTGSSVPSFKGTHPTAIIADDAQIGASVSIGPFAVIETGVRIGDDTTIYSGCYVGRDTSIGSGGLIYPNVIIRERVTIGKNVIIHGGTVIGSDGFGYVKVEGVHKKIPQIGTVVIEDDVEIGANTTIDRARFDRTIIGKGTKIDNLVQIAHNVVLGENCIIISQVGISGSVSVGKGAILAGQAGVTGHLKIGEGAIVNAQSGVTKSIPPHQHVIGFPAKPHIQMKRSYHYLWKLPEYIQAIKDLQRKVEELERKLQEKNSLETK